MRCLLGLWLAFVLPAQDPAASTAPAAPSVPTVESLWKRYQLLDQDHRQAVLRAMERRLLREDGDILQRIQGKQRGRTAYPQRPQPAWYEPAEYAPVAAPRHIVASGTDQHRAALRRVKAFLFLPDLHATVVYDWGLGKAVRIADSLSDDDRFENLIHGYVPGSDEAAAQVLEALDTDPQQRKLANFFAHLYADRSGNVFADTPMFDVWYSGATVEMPDTDVIAFARHVLGSNSLVAPIPDDAQRAKVYQAMRDAFAAHRDYRTLRLAAAGAFVQAEPRIDLTYEPLVRRFHWLWPQLDYQPKQLAERLAKQKDRTAFLTEVDASIRSTTDTIEATRRAFLETSDFLRLLADYELDRASK
jgi:hypothetical protein